MINLNLNEDEEYGIYTQFAKYSKYLKSIKVKNKVKKYNGLKHTDFDLFSDIDNLYFAFETKKQYLETEYYKRIQKKNEENEEQFNKYMEYIKNGEKDDKKKQLFDDFESKNAEEITF